MTTLSDRWLTEDYQPGDGGAQRFRESREPRPREKGGVPARYSAARTDAVGQTAREERGEPDGSAAARQADTGFVSHYVHGGAAWRAMMKNVTITLPDDLARWLRVRAAEDDRSVSRWIADLLAGMRRREDEYEVAMREFLAVKPRRMVWVDGRRPTREELHDRRRFSLTPNSQRTPATH